MINIPSICGVTKYASVRVYAVPYSATIDTNTDTVHPYSIDTVQYTC